MRDEKQPTVWYLLIRGSYIFLLRLVVPRKTGSDRSRTAEYYARLRRENSLPENVKRYVEDGTLPPEIDSSLLAMAIICKKSSSHQLTLKAALFLAELPAEEHGKLYQILVAHYPDKFAGRGVTIRHRFNAALNVKNTS